MIDTQIKIAARPLFGLAVTLALAPAFLGQLGAAQAAQMMFPKEKPQVAFAVPDNWAVKATAGEFEMSSPEKDSIVVGRIIGHDKSFIDAFAKEAVGKLQAFGIVFDEHGKPPPSATAGIGTIGSTSAFTTDADKFTFSGTPSLAAPGEKQSNNPVQPSENSLESLTGPAPGAGPMPKLPFKAVQYYGTSMHGKPVDVQLVLYNLPDKRLFVMMQESGPTDGRAVAIAQSVKNARAK